MDNEAEIMDYLITMDGEYAYECDPTVKVRILCVDGCSESRPVISMSKSGINYHRTNGEYLGQYTKSFDLVPLQRKPREWWVNLYESGAETRYKSEKEADCFASAGRIMCIRVDEAIE